MPIPRTRDIGKLVSFFKSDKPEWGPAQRLAVALDIARRHGAKIKKKKK